MNRIPRLALVLCLCLVLPGANVFAEQPNPNPVPSWPPQPMFPTQLIVCPDLCIECGHPGGIICCKPDHVCTVIWWPIWFGTEAPTGAGWIAPLRAQGLTVPPAASSPALQCNSSGLPSPEGAGGQEPSL